MPGPPAAGEALREALRTGERVYAQNDIDGRHLVSRAPAVWGDTGAEAAQANADTFHSTVRPGVDIPLPFCKVTVFIHEGELAASWPRWTGCLLPQPLEQLQSVPPGVS